MASTVNVNGRTGVHPSSEGVVTNFPDVCMTPWPHGPIPLPYPNIAQSRDTAQGSRTVKMQGGSAMLAGACFSQSTGDEPGSVGGVVSGCTRGKAEFVNYSFDVKVEGRGVCRLGDPMIQNKGGAPNTGPVPEMQPPLVTRPVRDESEPFQPAQLVRARFGSRDEYARRSR